MPKILFASNNAAHWSGCTISNSNFDATKVPYAVQVNTNTTSPKFQLSTSNETWVHFAQPNVNINTSITYQELFELRGPDQNGTSRRLFLANRNQFQAQANFVTYDGNGASGTYNGGTYQQDAIFDIQLKHTPFLLEYNIYKNGTLLLNKLFGSNPLGIQGIDVCSISVTSKFSEFFVSEGDTRGGRLNMLRPQIGGAYQEWAGSVLSIADDDPLSAMTTPTAGERHSFGFGGFAGIQNISNVVMSSYTKRGANSPTKMKHLLRRSAVDYESPDIDIGFSNQLNVTDYSLNPATSLPWVNTEIETTEFGFKAIA